MKPTKAGVVYEKTEEFQQRMQCLRGTFAAENMKIPPETMEALLQLDAGSASLHDLVRRAVQRHSQKQ